MSATVIAHAFRHFEHAKVLRMNTRDTEALQAVLRRRVQVSPTKMSTVGTLIKVVESASNDALAFIKGGVPRDIVSKSVPLDVDVAYTGASFAEVRNAFIKHYGQVIFTSKVAKIGLLGVGQGLDSFEATHLHLDKCSFDSAANTLLMHTGTLTFIDPFSVGMTDARRKVWRIPCDDKKLWAENIRVGIWRMIKFRVRKFHVPDQDMAFVFTHFMQQEPQPQGDSWYRHASAALKIDTLNLLKQACTDIDHLYGERLVPFTSTNFLLRLITLGLLAVAPIQQTTLTH